MSSLKVGHQRLKLLFSFLLGAVVTAVLFCGAWLQEHQYVPGNPCISSERRLRKTLPVFNIGSSDMFSTAMKPDSTEPLSAKSQVNLLLKPRNRSTSSYTIPTMSYGHRTHPIPPDATRTTSMSNRASDKNDCIETDYCREYLSAAEEAAFSECYLKCKEKMKKYGPIVNGGCHFMKGQGRLPVALASFPGSGNTWVRGLLEKVTGICTGGLYCDCGLRTGGFTGEGVQGSSVLVMKTHNPKVQFVGGHFLSNNGEPYGAAVLLIRDPRAALVAEWNREQSKSAISQKVSNHFTYVQKDYFGANAEWDEYIHSKLDRWPQQTVNLLLEAKLAGRPVHILKFEDMKADTVREIKRVTDFLGFSYNEKEVSVRLGSGFTQFYRNHTAEFSHLTANQEQYIHNVVYSTSQFMRENGIYDMFPGIDEYL